MGGQFTSLGDTTCLTILGLDPSIRAVMIADRRGGFIADRLAAEAKEEPFIPGEHSLAFPILKRGIVVLLRITNDRTSIRLLSAVENLFGTWPMAI